MTAHNRHPSTKPVPAVVLGLNPNSLGTIRSLRRAGIPVVAIARESGGWRDPHTWMSSKTRACEKVILPRDSGWQEFVEALLELAERHATALPVFPSGDDDLLMLSQYHNRLAEACHLALPTSDSLATLLDKSRFAAFCESLDLTVPRTISHGDEVGMDDVIARVRFPCLVKPEQRGDAWDRMFSPAKAFRAETPEELREHWQVASQCGSPLLVQEVVPGGDDELYFSHAYFDREGRTLASWTGRKLRQYPLGFGTSTLTETVQVAGLVDRTEQLARALSIHGYLSIEFKRDPRSGRFFIIEATPGRTWYPHYLGTVAGVNIPEVWYYDLLGQPIDDRPRDQFREGVRWVDEFRDIVAANAHRAAGRLSMREWLGSYCNVRGPAHISLRDPLPGIFVGLRFFISAYRAVARRITRSSSEG